MEMTAHLLKKALIRFLIAHHYSFRHSSYETAAKLVVGTEVA